MVVLVLDGLGWEQLQANKAKLATLGTLEARRLTTVAPTTTATALTSITTGLTPGEHGLIGYRMGYSGEIINVLRWWSERGDMRRTAAPRDLQPFAPFLGESPVTITRAELEGSAFTEAHLRGARMRGWRNPSSIAIEIGRQLRAGEVLVYAYYDGIDKIAHERGFGEFYDAELRTADRLVGDVIEQLVPGAMLLVTADHGQVMVGDREVVLHPDVQQLTKTMSGEGRFRWLHARPGAAADLFAACEEHHGHQAWIRTRAQTIDQGWFGPVVSAPVAQRLGDVALVAREPVTFFDKHDSGPYPLVCRHGSLTSAEVYVPLLVAMHGGHGDTAS